MSCCSFGTLSVSLTVSTTIPLRQDPLGVDVAGIQGMSGHSSGGLHCRETELGDSWGGGALLQRNRAWRFMGGFNAEKQSLGIPGGFNAEKQSLGIPGGFNAEKQCLVIPGGFNAEKQSLGIPGGFNAEKQSLGIPGGL